MTASCSAGSNGSPASPNAVTPRPSSSAEDAVGDHLEGAGRGRRGRGPARCRRRSGTAAAANRSAAWSATSDAVAVHPPAVVGVLRRAPAAGPRCARPAARRGRRRRPRRRGLRRRAGVSCSLMLLPRSAIAPGGAPAGCSPAGARTAPLVGSMRRLSRMTTRGSSCGASPPCGSRHRRSRVLVHDLGVDDVVVTTGGRRRRAPVGAAGAAPRPAPPCSAWPGRRARRRPPGRRGRPSPARP